MRKNSNGCDNKDEDMKFDPKNMLKTVLNGIVVQLGTSAASEVVKKFGKQALDKLAALQGRKDSKELDDLIKNTPPVKPTKVDTTEDNKE